MINKLKAIIILLLTTAFLTLVSAPALAAVSYTYDANGNMTSDGTNCYAYNEANELSQVKDCLTNQLVAEYVYDQNGTRIVKKEYTTGTLSKTIYSPEDEYETTKTASNGALSNTTYYFANDQLLARKNPDGSKVYYQNDHLGSATLITDQAGNAVEQTSYYPFGQIRAGGTNGKFQYTGQEKDPETGLDYYNARYYNPTIAHFTQPDDVIPLVYNPQTLNRYAYVQNNPIRYTDPTGHEIDGLYNYESDPGFAISDLLDRHEKNSEYYNSEEYKDSVYTRLHAQGEVNKLGIGVIKLLPIIKVPGIDVLDALNSAVLDNLDTRKTGNISTNEYRSIAQNAGGQYIQGKFNGFLSNIPFPGGGKTLTKQVANYIGNKVTDNSLEIAENAIYKNYKNQISSFLFPKISGPGISTNSDLDKYLKNNANLFKNVKINLNY